MEPELIADYQCHVYILALSVGDVNYILAYWWFEIFALIHYNEAPLVCVRHLCCIAWLSVIGLFSVALQHGYHGFPLGPSSMTFDPYRRLLYIGTNSGEIRM